jgi:ABC-type transporter MlaC component
MKSKAEVKEDNLVQRIGESVKAVEKLAHQAVQQYSAEVQAILNMQSSDSKRIERCLDGMLDFCFDFEMLALYKKLCRYYFEIDPESTASYVNAYRDMWDEQEGV